MEELDNLIKRIRANYEDIMEYKADYLHDISVEDGKAILEYLEQLREISLEDK